MTDRYHTLGKFDPTATPSDTDTDAVLASLRHDTKWLLELSNADPASFQGREEELYSVLNAMQLVTSRFASVAPSYDNVLRLVGREMEEADAKAPA